MGYTVLSGFPLKAKIVERYDATAGTKVKQMIFDTKFDKAYVFLLTYVMMPPAITSGNVDTELPYFEEQDRAVFLKFVMICAEKLRLAITQTDNEFYDEKLAVDMRRTLEQFEVMYREEIRKLRDTTDVEGGTIITPDFQIV